MAGPRWSWGVALGIGLLLFASESVAAQDTGIPVTDACGKTCRIPHECLPTVSFGPPTIQEDEVQDAAPSEKFFPIEETSLIPLGASLLVEVMIGLNALDASGLALRDSAGVKVGDADELNLGVMTGGRLSLDLGLGNLYFSGLFGTAELEFDAGALTSLSGIEYDADLYELGFEADVWRHDCTSDHFAVSLGLFLWTLQLEPTDASTSSVDFDGYGAAISASASWNLGRGWLFGARAGLRVRLCEFTGWDASANCGLECSF